VTLHSAVYGTSVASSNAPHALVRCRRLKVGHEQLEPTTGCCCTPWHCRGRNAHGEFFGEHRLVDFTRRAELAGLPAPETLRRLTAAVLAHQHGQLQDDATLVLLDWSPDAPRRLFPTLP
jgi:hypothetical protein